MQAGRTWYALRMLKKLGLGLGLIVAILLLVIALQPTEFRIERSATIEAPTPVVYGLINSPQRYDQWSPWADLDPGMEKSWSGPREGRGAAYAWSGNEHVGRGRMEITDARENTEVVYDLHFEAPFEARNVVLFTLTPRGDAVDVRWAMTGQNGFLSKAFGLFMDVDAMVGKDFEKGLAKLKQLAELEAQQAAR